MAFEETSKIPHTADKFRRQLFFRLTIAGPWCVLRRSRAPSRSCHGPYLVPASEVGQPLSSPHFLVQPLAGRARPQSNSGWGEEAGRQRHANGGGGYHRPRPGTLTWPVG